MDEIRNGLVKSLINDVTDSGYAGVSAEINTDGNTAIVGVPYGDSEKGINAGSAYIYTRNGDTWTEQSKLLASDGSIGDRFGYSVAISGDGNTIVIGAPAHNGSKGIVHVYIRIGDTWAEQTKLLASDGVDGDWFGSAVSINSNGNIVIIGAHWHNDGKGAAYIFTRTDSGWVEEAKLAVSDDDWFGSSVSINSDGDVVIVGTHWRSDGKRTGYVFNRRKTTNDIRWFQQFKLLASNGYFVIPTPINTDGDTTIVGVSHDNNHVVSN